MDYIFLILLIHLHLWDHLKILRSVARSSHLVTWSDFFNKAGTGAGVVSICRPHHMAISSSSSARSYLPKGMLWSILMSETEWTVTTSKWALDLSRANCCHRRHADPPNPPRLTSFMWLSASLSFSNSDHPPLKRLHFCHKGQGILYAGKCIFCTPTMFGRKREGAGWGGGHNRIRASDLGLC